MRESQSMLDNKNVRLISEGKSKRVYADDNWVYLDFKGDVRCSAFGTKYDERIAILRAKSSYAFYKYLSDKMEGIAYVEQVSSTILKMEYATPLPFEWIPRFVAAGSVVKRFDFKEGHIFKNPVLKIDYKTMVDDYLINDDLIIEMGIINEDMLKEARQLALDVANSLEEMCSGKNTNLWDLKLELGISKQGKIILIDEISFDGMRLKDQISGESLDKDVYRETGDVESVINAYEKGYMKLFGGEHICLT
ncbi:Phosphoribosylaminoimidazole-succinocarboxamide synthase [compost metagenome]